MLFYIPSSNRPNCWRSMFSTWPNTTRITTSVIGRVSFASSSCPPRRVERSASTLRNCSSPSNPHQSSSLHLKVQEPFKSAWSQLGVNTIPLNTFLILRKSCKERREAKILSERDRYSEKQQEVSCSNPYHLFAPLSDQQLQQSLWHKTHGGKSKQLVPNCCNFAANIILLPS